jgi:divalent metal cation (Fe/Co/Zn/Cd) transporter
MELETVLTIVSAILGVVAMVAGGFWLKAKGKIGLIANLVKQAYEVVNKVFLILEDNTISKQELEELKKEAQDVKDALKALVGK